MYKRRVFSFALALLMLLTCVFGVTTSANAASSLSKVKNVKATVVVTKSDVKIGVWYVYQKDATLTWDKVAGADGYEICYNPNGQGNKTVRTTNLYFDFPGFNVHGVGASLKIYPYYTVRVRAYDVVNGQTVYGPWSAWKIIWM